MSKRFLDFLWWLGVPLIIGILTWGPYVYLNITNNVSWSFWRIPFVPIYVFDAGAYFQWIGAALSDLDSGSHLGLFDPLIRMLGQILPESWSMAEVWLLTLWVSVTVGVFLFAKTFVVWSGSSPRHSRWFSVLSFVSFVLPFMPRPGVFTWYLPFYLFGLIGVRMVDRSLEESKYLPATLWSIAAIVASSTYPYFLLHIGIWTVVLWLVHVHAKFPSAVRMISLACIVLTAPVVFFITPLLLHPKFILAFELNQRLGLAFTRLPVLSNSLIALFVWTLFMFCFAWMHRETVAHDRRVFGLTIGWIVLLACWMSNLFTDVYIHNDHFRTPVLIMSWISLAAVFKVARTFSVRADQHSLLSRGWGHHLSPFIVMTFFVASLVAVFVYVLRKDYVFHADLLNVIHVSHWLALAIASFVLWNYSRPVRVKTMYVVLATSIIVTVLGVVGRGYVFAKEAERFSSYIPYIETISWIRTYVPEDDGVCTDAARAEIFGAFTMRMVYPTFASNVLPKSDESILQDIRTQIGCYDAHSVGEDGAFVDEFDLTRSTTCAQYGKLYPIFNRLGIDERQFKEISACAEDVVRENRERIRDFLVSRDCQDKEFRSLCPAVIVASDRTKFWTLPDDYQETKIDEMFSVWQSARRESIE